MRYHAEFGRSTSKDLGTPKIGARWGPAPLGRGRARPLQTHLSPRELPCRIWLPFAKRYERPCGDSLEKLGSSLPAFQGHSRSSEPTRTDWASMISINFP